MHFHKKKKKKKIEIAWWCWIPVGIQQYLRFPWENNLPNSPSIFVPHNWISRNLVCFPVAFSLIKRQKSIKIFNSKFWNIQFRPSKLTMHPNHTLSKGNSLTFNMFFFSRKANNYEKDTWKFELSIYYTSPVLTSYDWKINRLGSTIIEVLIN